jgi:hypothetical protein
MAVFFGGAVRAANAVGSAAAEFTFLFITGMLMFLVRAVWTTNAVRRRVTIATFAHRLPRFGFFEPGC